MPNQTARGKAARLQELTKIVRVKPFITISVNDVAYAIRYRHLPVSVQKQIGELNPALKYAVRSSAEGEDSATHAWAGQFKTLLDVEYSGLAVAVLECADALNSESVAAYAAAHALEAAGLEIIIQEMVKAELAGALFTRNPVGNDPCMVIEVVQGLGEHLMNGTAEPLRYYLHLETGAIVKTEGLNGFQLSVTQLSELFVNAKRIRGHFGGEEDIEFAFELDTGLLYTNQSRPITGLESLFSDRAVIAAGELNAKLTAEKLRLTALGLTFENDVLSNQNIAELLPEHPSRMAHGLFCYLFAHNNGAIKTGRNAMGYGIGSELDAGFQVLVGGQPRVSIVHDALSYRIRGIPLEDYALIVQDYLEKIADDESLANYPEVGLYEQHPSRTYLEHLFGAEKAKIYAVAYEEFFAGIRRLEHALRHIVADDFLPEWRGLTGHLHRHRFVESLSVSDAVAQYRLMCDLLRTRACHTFVQVARLGFFAYARARDLLIARFGKETGTEYLNTLMATSSTASPNYLFDQALFELKETGDIRNVMHGFGHLAAHELEISVPRYNEQPEILRMLASKTVDPTVGHSHSMQKAAELEALLEERFAETWGFVQREIAVARTYLELRELVKFEYLKGYDLLRRLAVHIEAKLGWDEGRIFNLDPTEVFRLATSSEELNSIAITRANERCLQKTLFVPSVFFSDDLASIGRTPSLDTSRCLHGIGVTNEVAEGLCVVVSDLSDTATLALIKPGCILVTVNSDPAWSPVFKALGRTGGVVTEIGGLLAHAATCAREGGLAAVLNVPNATNILKTGMRVRVDGPNSTVEVLSDE